VRNVGVLFPLPKSGVEAAGSYPKRVKHDPQSRGVHASANAQPCASRQHQFQCRLRRALLPPRAPFHQSESHRLFFLKPFTPSIEGVLRQPLFLKNCFTEVPLRRCAEIRSVHSSAFGLVVLSSMTVSLMTPECTVRRHMRKSGLPDAYFRLRAASSWSANLSTLWSHYCWCR
jgi:hypothetical protein